jgi:hypothetical protein
LYGGRGRYPKRATEAGIRRGGGELMLNFHKKQKKLRRAEADPLKARRYTQKAAGLVGALVQKDRNGREFSNCGDGTLPD